MRFLCVLIVALACGGKSDDKPAGNKAAEDAAVKIDELTTKICACKTKECAQQVNAEMDAWAVKVSKEPVDQSAAAPDLELRNRMTDRLNRFSTCLQTAMKLPDAPKP